MFSHGLILLLFVVIYTSSVFTASLDVDLLEKRQSDCQNGGHLVTQDDETFTCSCVSPYYGDYCEQTSYIGCYKDTAVRAMPTLALNVATLTIEQCISACRNAGFTYAGAQFYTFCFCGESYDRFGVAPQCTTACGGNANEMCGDAWTNSVYSVCPKGYYGSNCENICQNCDGACNSKTGECLTAPNFVGCYKDTAVRALPILALNVATLTLQQCIDTCRTAGFTYAGAQFYTFCFCGESYDRFGLAPQCTTACGGNSDQICGDAWTNSVYAVCPTGYYGSNCEYVCENCDGACNSKTGECLVVPASSYMGCYKDTAVRAMPTLALNVPTLTLQQCIAACRTAGFKYAGAQFYTFCFCGESYDRFGVAPQCTTVCGGNSDQICGDAWTNSVYAV